jgi:hypothetical protein
MILNSSLGFSRSVCVQGYCAKIFSFSGSHLGFQINIQKRHLVQQYSTNIPSKFVVY